MRHFYSYALLVLLSPGVAIGSDEQTQSSSEVPAALRATYTEYRQAMEALLPEKALEFFAPDSVVIVDSQNVFMGHDEILSGYLGPYLERAEGKRDQTVIPTVDQAVMSDTVVTFIGRYRRSGRPEGEFDGVYGNSWQLQSDGRWRLKASITTIEATSHVESGRQ